MKTSYFDRITVEELLSSISPKYTIQYKKLYILPFTKNQIKKDFDIELKDTTHIKLILKKV